MWNLNYCRNNKQTTNTNVGTQQATERKVLKKIAAKTKAG